MTSPTSKLCVILFSRDWKEFGVAFFVDITTRIEVIHDLKFLVRGSRGRDKQLIDVNAPDLTVWRCRDENIRSRDLKTLVYHIKQLFSGEKVEYLCPSKRLADLCISTEETLLVEVPRKWPVKDHDGKRPEHIISEADQEFEPFCLQVHTGGEVTSEDVKRNNIDDAYKDDAPTFVKEHEKMLSQKRTVPDEMKFAAEYLVDDAIYRQYFDSVRPQLDPWAGPWRTVGQIRVECAHFISVSNVYEAEVFDNVKHGTRRLFEGEDANWLFFYPLKKNIESVSSNVTVKLGEASWPFQLVMQVGKEERYAYRPESSFLILKFDLPRVVVEVNSNPSPGPTLDHRHLLLEGATVVRFANTSLEAYKQKKDFVFMATFINHVGQADRYLIYQIKGSDTVYCKRKGFHLADPLERITFLLELYNISYKLQNDGENWKADTQGKVRMLAERVKKMNLPTFKGDLKGPPSDDGRKKPEFGVHLEGGSGGGAIEQLKSCGYEVMPDVWEEMECGTWKPLVRPLPHIRTVYRQGDPKKTELIAKRVSERSNEPDILQYLHTKQRRSPHVISLIEAIPINKTQEWLILPKLHSIDQYFLDRGDGFHRNKLGWGLIKGLAYLHEHNVAHRDIKPENLVRDDKYCLQIINFDIAVRVPDEDTMIHEFRGTIGWTAPEIRRQGGPARRYSPIKADRWACGQVLLFHLGVVDNSLRAFARQLMANDPKQRPSPLEWLELKSVQNDDMGVGGSWQDMAWFEEEEDERMKPPDAKKPRLVPLASDFRSPRQRLAAVADLVSRRAK